MDRKKSVSILKETKEDDMRVILLPKEIKKFIDKGFHVYVEHNAGVGVKYPDEKYKAVGAEIVNTKKAWTCSDYIVKCRCPSKEKWEYFRPGLHLASTFYAGSVVRKN